VKPLQLDLFFDVLEHRRECRRLINIILLNWKEDL